ncbi:MAG TPA: MFS transporter [Terriglobales bacterium]|nr:MFS transporter [Terriglobales bacterium]
MTGTWYRTATSRQWRVLGAAMFGWMLDGMDVMLYSFALTHIQHEFGFSSAIAGGVASVTLLSSAFGGVLFGYLADRFGRTKALGIAILTYSIFTAATAMSHSLAELIVWRLLVGLGLGGEWAAGAALVAEEWPAEHRGKAIGIVQSGWALGYIAAALLAASIIPSHGWRVLFVVGVAPALLSAWIWRSIPEPEVWRTSQKAETSVKVIFTSPLLRTTVIAIAVCSFLMFAYWGLFTWVPAYLASPRESGGAGMSIVKSASWIVPMQIGAFFGYTSFGFLADRFGRRPTFLVFVLCAAACVPVYGFFAKSPEVLLVTGPLLGFFGHGYFSVFGAMLAELFPSGVRATAQGLCYNAGRGISALAPLTIGSIADRRGIGTALACTSIFYIAGALMIYLLPETKGRVLK